MGMHRRALAMLAMMLALSAGRAATAQPAGTGEEARKAYERGDALFLAGKYDEAIAELTRAYELSKAPELLFNIAQAQRLGGHCREAVVAYETYLARAPRGRRRADARAFITELGDCANQPPARGSPTPDESTTAPDEAVTPPAGAAPAAAESPAQPEEAVTAAQPSPRDRGRGKRVAGLATGVAGIALAATGVYFVLDARDKAAEVESYRGEWGPDQVALQKAGKRSQTLAVVFTGVGTAALVGGAVFYVLGRRQGSEATVTLSPTAGGAALVWSGRF